MILEDIPAEDASGLASSTVNTGLFSALEEIRSEMLNAGALTVAAMTRTRRVDSWALADAVYDDVLDRLPTSEGQPSESPKGTWTGLKAAEDEVYAAHEREGTQISRSYLHDLYVTVRE